MCLNENNTFSERKERGEKKDIQMNGNNDDKQNKGQPDNDSSCEIAALSERINATEKGMEGIKSIFKIIAAAISIFAALGAIFGTINIIDSLIKSADFQRQKKELTTKINGLQTLINIERRRTIKEILKDSEKAISDFSISQLDPHLLEKIKANQKVVKELLEITNEPPGKTSSASRREEDKRTLSLISQINEGLIKLEDTKKIPKKKRSKYLNEASEIFILLDCKYDSTDPDYINFLFNIEAYRNNVLGVIEFRRYKFIQPSSHCLDAAEKYFDAAKKADNKFARPYSNMMVVLIERYEKRLASRNELSEKDIEEFQTILTNANELLKTAFNYSEGEREKSVILNNQSFVHLKEFELYKDRDKYKEKSDKALDEAKKKIDEALKREQINPAVYTTKAEILGYSLIGKKDKIRPLLESDKKDILNEIKENLKDANEKGYRFSKDYLEENPYKNLPEKYLTEIKKVVKVED